MKHKQKIVKLRNDRLVRIVWLEQETEAGKIRIGRKGKKKISK